MSTGGLKGPDVLTDGDLWFISIYSMIGVPLYASFVGHSAARLSRHLRTDHTQVTEMRAITRAASQQNAYVFNQAKRGELDRSSTISSSIAPQSISVRNDSTDNSSATSKPSYKDMWEQVRRAESTRQSHESPHVSGRFDPVHIAQKGDDSIESESTHQMSVT